MREELRKLIKDTDIYKMAELREAEYSDTGDYLHQHLYDLVDKIILTINNKLNEYDKLSITRKNILSKRTLTDKDKIELKQIENKLKEHPKKQSIENKAMDLILRVANKIIEKENI